MVLLRKNESVVLLFPRFILTKQVAFLFCKKIQQKIKINTHVFVCNNISVVQY